jgi:polyribonucleotide nucleotidyltransferase
MAIIREGAKLGNKEIILETGRMAKQAAGSVMIQYGESQILCTAQSGGPRPVPFFPLTCDYVENFWAAGEIPGGYLRREGRPGDKATLTSRLIDRPARPLFPDAFQDETQLIAWVLSADLVNDTDVLAITGCSAALMISDIPWNGPVAGVRVGLVDDEFIANPTFAEREESEMDIILAATPDAIVMVEGLANEVPEDVMAEALEFGQKSVRDVLDLQLRLAESVGKPKIEVEEKTLDGDIMGDLDKHFRDKLQDAITIPTKMERYAALDAVKAEAVEKLSETYPEQEGDIKDAVSALKKDLIRTMVLKEEKRIDGRAYDEVRDISIEVGVIPKAHGSALFTRGETQALVTTTLGTERDAQRLDTLEGDIDRPFMLHYNFPPFCVGETRRLTGTKRREVGHGYLAERGLSPALPNLEDEFPYTIRVVSDVLESNGSSSMASVCGGSLSMFDAGVPFKQATAGIAMGLITDGEKFAVLSDILGDEDHIGDMDFKVVGTRNGITAFQLDTKIAGLTKETMLKALNQAKSGRDHILDKMDEVLAEPRQDLSANAPRIVNIKIPPASIGAVIGSGGSTIRGIQEATGTTINIDDDGTVSIASNDAHAAQQAIEIVEGLTAQPEQGETYMGTVQKVVDFGAFIEILPGTDGLCHISELTEGRVDKVEDVLQEGDEVLVKVLEIKRNGKISLSRRAALEEQGEEEGADSEE